jgi:hypothetical protein
LGIRRLELLEGGLRRLEIAIAKLRERAFIHAPLSRVDRDLLAVEAQGNGFDTLQTGVQIEGGFALALVGLGKIIGLHFNRASQGGDFLAHRAELVLQIELAATALLHAIEPSLHVIEAAGEVALHQIELAAQIENGAARFVIGKELRLHRLGECRGQRGGKPCDTDEPAGQARETALIHVPSRMFSRVLSRVCRCGA